MTQEQNKLAEEIGNCGFYADPDGTTFRIIPAKLSEQIISALREPATEAVLRQRMRDIFKNHGVGDGTPGWIEHMGQDGQLRRDSLSFEGELIFNIEALLENAALKGKGNVRLRVPTKKLTC